MHEQVIFCQKASKESTVPLLIGTLGHQMPYALLSTVFEAISELATSRT